MCPHILRYLTTAVITNKRRKAVLKDLVKVIQQVRLKLLLVIHSIIHRVTLTKILIMLGKWHIN